MLVLTFNASFGPNFLVKSVSTECTSEWDVSLFSHSYHPAPWTWHYVPAFLCNAKARSLFCVDFVEEAAESHSLSVLSHL